MLADERHHLAQLASTDEVRAARKPRAHVDQLTVAIAELVIEVLDRLEHVPPGEALLERSEQAVEDVQDEKRAAE